MNTPTPLTPEEIDDEFEKVACLHAVPVAGKPLVLSVIVAGNQTSEFARAIESEVNARWLKMLGEQEPVAWQERQNSKAGWGRWYPCSARVVGTPAESVVDGITYQWRPVYAHPAPDHTDLLRQALDALEDFDYDKRIATINAIREELK